jgi:hypothetical protein
MLVGMIQSSYLPWRGYFDFIASVDCFVLYDDIPIGMGRTWRNRNLIKTPRGVAWVTVPIHHDPVGTRICDVRICYKQDWIARQSGQLTAAYRNTPYFNAYFPRFREIVHRRHERLSVLNEELIRWIAGEIGIATRILPVEILASPGAPRDIRPIQILEQLGATAYLTGPNTLAYTNCCVYSQHGISLRVKDYTYAPYQQTGDDFVGQVSVLDLLFNMGPTAYRYLRAQKPDMPPPCPKARCDRIVTEKT